MADAKKCDVCGCFFAVPKQLEVQQYCYAPYSINNNNLDLCADCCKNFTATLEKMKKESEKP